MEANIIILILSVLLIFSIIGNIVLGWYCRKIIAVLTIAKQLSTEFFIRLINYVKHLENIYQLQVFHGDPTIRALIKHTKEISEYLKAHDEITSFIQPDLLDILTEIDRQEEVKQEQDEYKQNKKEENQQ